MLMVSYTALTTTLYLAAFLDRGAIGNARRKPWFQA